MLPVLLYHNLEQSSFQFQSKPVIELPYILPVAQFEQQIAYLAEQGFQSILPRQLQDPLPDKPVIISFDNGHESQRRLALPILQKYGFKAVFFITTDYLEIPDYLNMNDVKLLNEMEMEIGSHGVSHQLLDDVPNIEVEHELEESQRILSGLLGKPVVSFSIPNGQLHAEMRTLAILHYKQVFGGRFGFYQAQKGRFNIPRLAIKRNLSFTQFQSLLQQDPKLLRQFYCQDWVLFIAKFILGKAAYDISRSALLTWLQKRAMRT